MLSPDKVNLSEAVVEYFKDKDASENVQVYVAEMVNEMISNV